MRRVIIGTAGHIDHGKTALLKALTGIDADRLPEEKDRGITIDLGFAHLEEGETRMSFIDAPGHERFVHNMLAGAGGLDALLLVVAADEGIRPQTREHVAIADLLGLRLGLVALTKRDRVSESEIRAVSEELSRFLRGSFLEEAPILPVSARSGEGLPELRRALIALAESARERRQEGNLRLPVDRAFPVAGFGPVVTGSLVSGGLSPEDRVEVLPQGLQARVRRVEVHGQVTARALAGERSSVNLAGVEISALHRGQMLISPGSLFPTKRLLASLRLIPEAPQLESGAEAVFYHFASETTARVRLLGESSLPPGGSAFALLTLRESVAAALGDRFVLRRPSPAQTIGGGEIRDAHPPRKIETADVIAFSSADPADRRRRRIEREPRGILLSDLSRAENTAEEELAGQLSGPALSESILIFPPRQLILSRSRLRGLADRARRLVEEEVGRRPGAVGAGTALVLKQVFGGFEARDAEAILTHLAREGILELAQDETRIPGRAFLQPRDRSLAEEILRLFEERRLDPPPSAELAAQLGAKKKIVEGLVGFLLKDKRLVRLPGGLILSAKAVEEVSGALRASGRRTISVPEFKEMFGLSRRLAIPLLEHLDEKRVTRRQGEGREILS